MPHLIQSPAEMLAHVLWFCHPDLGPAMEPRFADQRQAVYFHMQKYSLKDDTGIERILTRVENQTGDLIKEVTRVHTYMFTKRHGRPALKSGFWPRMLIRAIDPDMLIALGGEISQQALGNFDWPTVPLFAETERHPILERGTVDTHVHLGGVLPPLFFWLPMMGGEASFHDQDLGISRNQDLARRELWRQKIHEASILRLWMAARMSHYFSRKQGLDLFPHIPSTCWEETAFIRDWQLDPFTITEGPVITTTPARETSWTLLKTNALKRNRRHDHPFVDPLRPFYINPNPPSPEHPLPHFAAGERSLLHYTGLFLRETPSTGQSNMQLQVAAVLRDYLRIRNAFHRLVVHDVGSDGLFRFLQTFSRRKSASNTKSRSNGRRRRHRRNLRKMECNRMQMALDTLLVKPYELSNGGRSSDLKHRAEIRVSLGRPREANIELYAWINGLTRFLQMSGYHQSPYWNTQQPPADQPLPCAAQSPIGLIFHFHKKHNAETTNQETAKRLGYLLASYPNLRGLVVGIDAAGRERDSPPRAFVSAYHHLQKHQSDWRDQTGHFIHLGYTYHVGEDFDDLLNALRHIDEVACLLHPRNAGGRLGHALALGEKPKRFYRNRMHCIELSIRARLLDLIWAWGRLHEMGRLQEFSWLEVSIADLVEHVSVGWLQTCYRGMRLDWHYRREDEPEDWSEDALLDICLKNGQRLKYDRDKMIGIEMDADWLQLIETLQILLRNRLAQRPICIEANPTSNLLVGGYLDYAQLPYAAIIKAGLPLSLNTDDPGMFMTCLPGEFAAMYQSFGGKQFFKDQETKTHRERLEWLEARIKDAQNSTFLPSNPPILRFGSESVTTDYLAELFKMH